MNRKEIAIAILAAGSVLAQQQSGANPVVAPTTDVGALPGISVSGGAASERAPKTAPALDVPASTQVLLPGCEASRGPRGSANRDYSTPASRLVGRWASMDPATAGVTCHYFSPIDKDTDTGVYVSYVLEAMDKETGKRSRILPGSGTPPHTASWSRNEESYRIADEDPHGDWVTVKIFPPKEKFTQAAAQGTIETHRIACNGMSDHRETVEIARYVDGKNLACSDGDERWKDDFSRYLARRPTVVAVLPRTGHDIQYKVEGPYKASLTYRNATGGTDQTTVALPWTLTFIGQPKQFVYLSAQNTEDWGSIECTIYLDGVPVRKASANSPYGIASVSGTIPSVQ
jgi:hypothetical protein